jgi:hypothetical protein
MNSDDEGSPPSTINLGRAEGGPPEKNVRGRLYLELSERFGPLRSPSQLLLLTRILARP